MGKVFIIFIVAIMLLIWNAIHQKQKRLKRFEEHILYADRTNDSESLDIFMQNNNLSYNKYYHRVRKKMYKRLAEDDDSFALTILALEYAQVPEPACRYLTRAAELGNVEAMFTLGLMHSKYCNENSTGYGYDANKSFFWYKQAADSGHEDAAWYVTMAYHDGEGVEKNQNMAFQYAKEQAECGNAMCAFYLVDYFYYRGGSGPHGNFAEAIRLLERIMRRGNREHYARAADCLGGIFSSSSEKLLPNTTYQDNRFLDKGKAAYCYALAYFADIDDIYPESNIFKSGYRATKFELEQWRDDAIQLRYNPI